MSGMSDLSVIPVPAAGAEDVVVGEGRRIVFVEPRAARALDLTASAAIVVPAFLDAPEYRELLG